MALIRIEGNGPGRVPLAGTHVLRSSSGEFTVSDTADGVHLLGTREQLSGRPSQMVVVEVAPGDRRKFHRDQAIELGLIEPEGDDAA